MKARYNRISKAQHQAIHSEMRRQQEGITRRLMKLMCIALNESEGFGNNMLADDSQQDEIFWTHVDRRIRQLGITEKEMPDEDYEVMDK